MPATIDLAARIAEESATLSPDKQSTVLDFVLFVKQQAERAVEPALEEESEGDAAWERIIANPNGYPKLEAYLRETAKEGSEPFDYDRL